MTPITALAAYEEDKEVLEAQGQAVTIADRARALQVNDEPSNDQALELLTECRKTQKRIEELRKAFVAPLNEHVKNINAYFAQNAAPVKEADTILSQKTSTWRAKVQEIVRKKQEHDRLMAERAQERAAVKAERHGHGLRSVGGSRSVSGGRSASARLASSWISQRSSKESCSSTASFGQP